MIIVVNNGVEIDELLIYIIRFVLLKIIVCVFGIVGSIDGMCAIIDVIAINY